MNDQATGDQEVGHPANDPLPFDAGAAEIFDAASDRTLSAADVLDPSNSEIPLPGEDMTEGAAPAEMSDVQVLTLPQGQAVVLDEPLAA